MPFAAHPGSLLRRELRARKLSANRLVLDLGVPSGRITDILNERRSITADTAVRLGRYFGNTARFWLDFQNQYDIALIESEKGAEISRRMRPPTQSRLAHTSSKSSLANSALSEMKAKRA